MTPPQRLGGRHHPLRARPAAPGTRGSAPAERSGARDELFRARARPDLSEGISPCQDKRSRPARCGGPAGPGHPPQSIIWGGHKKGPRLGRGAAPDRGAGSIPGLGAGGIWVEVTAHASSGLPQRGGPTSAPQGARDCPRAPHNPLKPCSALGRLAACTLGVLPGTRTWVSSPPPRA